MNYTKKPQLVPSPGSSSDTVRVELVSIGCQLQPRMLNDTCSNDDTVDTRKIQARRRRTSCPHGSSAGLAGGAKAAHAIPAAAVSPDSIQHIKLLGEGAYAKVWKAKYTAADGSQTTVAVKRLRPQPLRNPEDRELFVAEGRMLQRIHHPNVVGFVGMGRVEGGERVASGLFIVQEYVSGGTLGRMVQQQMLSRPMRTYSLADAVRWMAGVARGLDCLHTEGVMHRDLKLDNILLAGKVPHTSTAKIADLGLHTQIPTPSLLRAAATCPPPNPKFAIQQCEDAPTEQESSLDHNGRVVGVDGRAGYESGAGGWRPAGGSDGQMARLLSGKTGSLMYMAPEVFHSEHYSHKADIFSYGMILHEVLHGFVNIFRLPNASSCQDLDDYAAQVAQGHRPPLSQDLPQPLAALITRCWHQDPDKRPEASEIMQILEKAAESEDVRGGEGTRASARCCVIS